MNNFLHCCSFPLSQQRTQFPARLAFASQMQKTWWWSLRYLIGRINNFCPCSCNDEQHEREQPLQDMGPLAFHAKREALQLSESDWKLFRTLFTRTKSVTWNLPLPHNPSQQSQQRTKEKGLRPRRMNMPNWKALIKFNAYDCSYFSLLALYYTIYTFIYEGIAMTHDASQRLEMRVNFF